MNARVCLYFLALVLLFPASPVLAGDDADRLQRVNEMYAGYREDFPEVPDISAQLAMRLRDFVRIVFVDVREPEEQAVSMLPGALTRDEFMADHDQYADALVVGYCTISYRSGVWAAEMLDLGVEVVNLKGGLLAWTHAGGHLVGPDGEPIRKAHVYGRKWDLLPSGYESVW